MTGAASLLITGSTGMAGREITRVLLMNTDCELTLLLHDQGHGLSRERLLRDLFRMQRASTLIRRIRLVRGDLTQDRLGLPDAVYAHLAGRAQGIIHAAAATRFDLALVEARRMKVAATRP